MKNIVYNIVNYFPGFIILLFSMFALHSSLRLIEHAETSAAHHFDFLEEIASIENTSHILDGGHASQARVYEDLQSKEKILYWSVIAIGLAGFVLVVLNTDKLKKLKKAHQEKHDNLLLLESRLAAMELTFDGIVIADKDGHITYVNKAFMGLYGAEPDDAPNFIGRDWRFLYADENEEKAQENAIKALADKGQWNVQKTITRENGDQLLTEVSCIGLSGGGFIGMVRDISGRMQAQKEKEALQSQFYQAQKMEAVGRLAGGIAHDFNNILAAMNGYAEFLIEDLGDDMPQSKFAKNILQAGMQARVLVDQILTFSRIKSAEVGAVNLVESVKESLSMVGASFPKRIELSADVDAEDLYVNGNMTQIAQVIMNLCVNAKDAMMGGRGQLNITLQRMEISNDLDPDFVFDDFPDKERAPITRFVEGDEKQTRLFLSGVKSGHSYAVLKISDTGMGMSRSVMEHIFEPFFTTKAVDKGTGLGLSMAHGVIVGHNGAMIIDSTVGLGTSFQIFFPEVTVEEETQAVEVGAQFDMLGYKILLVEDQRGVRDMMVAMLERMGLNVCVAVDGLCGLDALREDPDGFDVVLTDQNMPNMTGLELIQEAQFDCPDLPFVLLSGYSEERLQNLIQEQPSVKATLRKPVSQKKLRDTLASVILETQKKAAA